KSQDATNNIGIYPSVRGDLKAVASNVFQTTETFLGLLPTFAIPGNEEFESDEVSSYLYKLEAATRNLQPAGDAYWEGKNLHPLGMGVLMADQLGETELRDIFLARMKTILVNWFTYDGDDDVSFFIYNKNWGTLYYLHSEFGANASICDHHFTYGYFMFAATVLATYDNEFYTDYKEMIELMIRDYANPSSDDSDYCRFRSYDLYEGHSWAGGYADNDSGNNQESASESLFSWVTLYLWGVLTGQDNYRDAGVFGFTNEMDTVKQYWFDYDLDNWIEDWPYEVVGQVYGGINFYGTFFGGQPLYIYGIQWLPISEYLTYYGMDQKRCADIYQALLDDTDIAIEKAVKVAKKEGKSQDEIQAMLDSYPQADTGWQHITWPFLSQTNPVLALDKFNANVSKIQNTDTANTYWFINSMIDLGYKTDKIWVVGDVSASVYYNDTTKKYTATVWNPTNESKTVRFMTKTGVVGTAEVGTKALVSFEVFVDKTFTITQASTPVISVPTGSYDNTQYVEITASTPNATIYYTTDGSVPNKNSKVYDGIFAVSSTATVKAIAVKDEMIQSPMTASTITIKGADVSYDTNLAAGKNVTASSSENPSTDGSKMVDGDTSTRWSSSFNDEEWFEVDLGANYSINKITFNWEASYASAYNLQVSTDGKTWTNVYETANANGGKEEIIINAVTCRYVKFQGVKRALAYGYSIWEFGVYEAAKVEQPTFNIAEGSYKDAQNVAIACNTAGVEIRYTTDGSMPTENSLLYVPTIKVTKTTTIKAVAFRKGMIASDVAEVTYIIDGTGSTGEETSTVNVAKGKDAFSSGSEADVFDARYAVDGDNGTRWSSNFADDAWIVVDLGKVYSIDKVVFNWEGAYAKAYNIQVSEDQNNWTTVHVEQNGTGGEESITLATTKARYVKMQGIERALPYGYSLWEFAVYGK
ncbi:discoidin domain-containing protein, partial [Anaerosporobacter sp.]|uniref:discoidin domain-containing protein n=1 Tax=Anaerosporobacter sp. TaxID=1872529 RepID=UPI00286F5F77